MKKTILFVSLAAVIALTVAAVGCTKADTNNGTDPKKPELSGSLKIGGSTTVLPLAQAAAEEFMAANPQVNIEVQGTGSSEGIKGVMEGTLDIGNSSRELKPEETGLVDFKPAVDAIGIVVNPGNKVASLTSDQTKDILSGAITNWKDVGGKDAKIQVIGRDEASGTRDYVQKDIIGKDAKFPADALAMPGTGQLKAAVAQTPDAIGYMSAAQADQTVKLLSIDGVKPSQKTIDDGSYKYQRALHMFTKGEPSSLAKSFFDFIMTDGFQQGTVAKEFFLVKQ